MLCRGEPEHTYWSHKNSLKRGAHTFVDINMNMYLTSLICQKWCLTFMKFMKFPKTHIELVVFNLLIFYSGTLTGRFLSKL